MRFRSLDALVLVYAILLIALGIYAYLDVHHLPSMLGGVGSGVVELLFLAYTSKNPRVGRMGAAIVALLLFFMFFGMMIQKGPAWNNVTIALASLIVVVALVGGHMTAMSRRRAQQG